MSLNAVAGEKQKQVGKPVEVEGEENVQMTSTEVSAPTLDATAISDEGQPSQDFQWVVERLYAHNPQHSMARTWFVRILGLVVGIPTLILDLGRRLAFSLGLVDGKSWSLIDEVSTGCKAVSDRVSAAWKSYTTPKELTLEEENERSKLRVQKYAQRLVDGYKNLNGGYFHTNSSFSSPHALRAEEQIRQAKADLSAEVYAFVARNVQVVDDFPEQIEVAEGIVREAINAAAGDEFFVRNKTVRVGEPNLVRDVAYREFIGALRRSGGDVLAEQCVEVSARGDNFAADLRKGVELSVLTAERAAEALEDQAQSVYMQGLETGVQEAERAVHALLDAGVKEGVVTRNEAVEINAQVQPDVEILADAAARDIARNKTAEDKVVSKLLTISKDLRKAKRLEATNESWFLTSAEAKLAKAKKAFEAERLRMQKESDKVEAQRVAAVQKSADQQSLFAQFEGMLGLIAKKQSAWTSLFGQYSESEVALQEVAAQVKAIQSTKVTIRGNQVTVLQAANEYYNALNLISTSRMTPLERKAQMEALAAQGFTQQTLERIAQLQKLEPKLSEMIESQAARAQEIETKHDELSYLRGVYKVFRKNNFSLLEIKNREAIAEQEKVVDKTQKALTDNHLTLVGKKNVRARLRLDEPSVPVNIDSTGNRSEVAAFVKAFQHDGTEEDDRVPYKYPPLTRCYHVVVDWFPRIPLPWAS